MSAAPVPRLRKGDLTRAAIIEVAMDWAARQGLEGLTIGGLSEALQMSKSGVFAHFGSREELQLAVLRAYAQRFVDDVLRVAVASPRGMARLWAIAERWLDFLVRALDAGCILIGSATEYDDRAGPVHDVVVELVSGWQGELIRALTQAQEVGHVRRNQDLAQAAFEWYGLMLSLHQSARLLQARDATQRTRMGIERLLRSVATPAGARVLAQCLRHR